MYNKNIADLQEKCIIHKKVAADGMELQKNKKHTFVKCVTVCMKHEMFKRNLQQN